MASTRNILIYSMIALCIFCISIYSMYMFGMNTSIFFTTTELLIPFMQKLSIDYTQWHLPIHLLLIPDACIYYIFSCITSTTQEALIAYIIFMTVLTYIVLIATLQKRIGETNIPLYISIWTMIVILYFSVTPLLARIFLPNGLLGFMLFYYIAMHLIYVILHTRYAFFSKITLACILVMLTFSTPLLTFIFIGIPALSFSFLQRRIEYPTEKHLQLDILVTLSISIGFILQLYFFPSKHMFITTTMQPIPTIIHSVHPLLLITSAIGLIYTLLYAFSNKEGSTLATMRITALGIVLGALCVISSLLDPILYFLFVFFFTLIYAIPHCIVMLTSLFSLNKVYTVNTIVILASIIILTIVYYHHQAYREGLPIDMLTEYLESTLPQDNTQYILAPRGIATEITLFSTHDIIAIPYIPNTLEYSSFIPDDSITHTYSALIIEKDFKDTVLIQQLLTLIGQPTHTENIGEYIIMEYAKGFTMPNAGELATYTTPLGNIIRNSLTSALSIPLPPSFTLDSLPVKEIRLLHDEGKYFIAIVFDKNTSIPTNINYSAYTLSPASSALRKLASGIRRELPFLASILPLEDKSSQYVDSTKDIYVLHNGDSVIAINITKNAKDSLTFLSLAIDGAKPSIVFQYPTPPISLS